MSVQSLELSYLNSIHQSPVNTRQSSTQLFPSSINAFDRHVLMSRSIEPEVALARGTRTVTAEECPVYGFTGNHALGGLLIPSYGTQGLLAGAQLRPHHATIDPDANRDDHGGQKIARYLWPTGTRAHIDVHPFSYLSLRDPSIPIVITESLLKADAIISNAERGKFCVLGIAGVYGWRSQGAPLTDHDDFPWCTRERGQLRHRRWVYLAFDSDANTSADVAGARWRYTEYLRRRGADVFWIDVPGTPAGQKQGVDDALAAGSTFASMIELAYTAPDQPPALACTDRSIADTDQLANLQQRLSLAEERAEALSAQNRALMALIRNPYIKPTAKMVAVSAYTLAHAKRSHGEVENDGSVRLSTGEISNDYRPVPKRGESISDLNPLDGSKPLTKRSYVVAALQSLADVADFRTERVRKKHRRRSRSYQDTDILIRPSETLAEDLNRLASFDIYQKRKDYTRQAPCQSCGEVHPRTQKRYCDGCGAEYEPPKVLPAPPTSNGGAPISPGIAKSCETSTSSKNVNNKLNGGRGNTSTLFELVDSPSNRCWVCGKPSDNDSMCSTCAAPPLVDTPSGDVKRVAS